MFSSLKKFNKKHNITGRTFAATKATIAKAQEVNNQYAITDKIGKVTSAAAKKASEANKQYGITDKAGAALGKGLDAITKAANGTLPPEDATKDSDDEDMPVAHATLKN